MMIGFDRFFKIASLILVAIGIVTYASLNRYEFFTHDGGAVRLVTVCDRFTGETSLERCDIPR